MTFALENCLILWWRINYNTILLKVNSIFWKYSLSLKFFIVNDQLMVQIEFENICFFNGRNFSTLILKVHFGVDFFQRHFNIMSQFVQQFTAIIRFQSNCWVFFAKIRYGNHFQKIVLPLNCKNLKRDSLKFIFKN